MTKKRIEELCINKNLRSIKEIRDLWYKNFKVAFDVSAFQIIDRDSNFELNSRIDFPYAIVVNNKPVYGHLSVHLRKGIWYFDEQGGDFKMSSFDFEQYKDDKWFNEIEKLLFKSNRVCLDKEVKA